MSVQQGEVNPRKGGWKGKWIWIAQEKNSHNRFVLFRKELNVNKVDFAEIKISADTRYELYVNDRFVGRGPVRSWLFEYSFDTYEITDDLKPGKNSIVVLVHHWGISTFQNIEAAAGLIAEISIKSGRKKKIFGTDSSWLCAEHKGFKRYAPRMSCQTAFCEIFDAKEKIGPWRKAKEVEVMDKDLVPRDIPYPSMEYYYPRRITSIRKVRMPYRSFSFDLRPYVLPEILDANMKFFTGFLAFKIISEKEQEGNIIQSYYLIGDFKLNGELFNSQKSPERNFRVRLKKGENILVMGFRNWAHILTTDLVLRFPYKVKIDSINHKGYPAEVISFGGFSSPWHELVRKLPEPEPVFNEIWNSADAEVLKKYRHLSKPVSEPYICEENVFLNAQFCEEIEKVNVDENFNRIVYPNNNFAEIKNDRGDTEIVLDFGDEFFGYLEFDIKAGKDNILDFYIFEHIDDQTDAVQHMYHMNNTLRYKCREGRQKFTSFVRRGGRFLNLTVRGKSPVRIYSVRIINASFPVSYRGIFRSNDHTLMNIYDLSRKTVKMCMDDTFMDCPTWEQTFWVGDSRNESLINLYTFGAYAISRRCLLLVPKSMYRSPIPESQVPGGWANILTDWTWFWINACREYYDFTGDDKFLKEIYPWLIKTIKNTEQFINRDGLLEINAWNMLDWAPMDCPTFGVVTHQNAFLVRAVNDIIYLSDFLNKDEDRKYLERFRDNLKSAINKHLYSEEKQAFYDSIHEDGKPSSVFSIQTQTAVYLSDAATEDRIKRLEELILNPPQDFVKIGSPFMSFFYLECLVKMGKFQEMLDYIRKNWGERMIDKGAVACWECFDRTRSHCHAWSAAPGYFLPAYILGIRPGAPGFKKVIIDPKPCDLKWARGCVPTPGGDIYIEWKKKEDGTLEVNTRGAI